MQARAGCGWQRCSSASSASSRRAARRRTRSAPTPRTCSQFGAWASGRELEPGDVAYRAAARLRRGALGERCREVDDRAQARRGAQLLRSSGCDRRAGPEPRRAAAEPEARLAPARGRSAATRSRRCSSASRRASRSTRATGRCSSSPTPAGCAARRSSTSTSTRSTSTPRCCASPARATRRASSRSASRLSARSSATWRTRGPRSRTRGRDDAEALFLSRRGRRLSPSDVRRRLARWVERRRDRRRRLPARAAPLVRDPPARGRRRPALDPGAARPRERLDDPDLHARGSLAPAKPIPHAPIRVPETRMPSRRRDVVVRESDTCTRAASGGTTGASG